MKYISFFLLLLIDFCQLSAQKITKENIKQLQLAEAAIKGFGKAMITEEEWFDR
ncbi:MAG: hypothetical protein H7068_06340, partial [Pedobacter sp.]|nr:hypothetical protein [Chitinophagaceae bacterium]